MPFADIHSPPDSAAGAVYLLILLLCFVLGLRKALRRERAEERWRSGVMPPPTEAEPGKTETRKPRPDPNRPAVTTLRRWR